MARKPQDLILHLRRVRSMPDDGHRTLYALLTRRDELFDRLGFVRPGDFPEFEGEAAWVRVHWWSKTNYRIVEQVADRYGSPMPGHGT